jgi:hypothetical protein
VEEKLSIESNLMEEMVIIVPQRRRPVFSGQNNVKKKTNWNIPSADFNVLALWLK